MENELFHLNDASQCRMKKKINSTIGRLNCLVVAHKALRFDSKMIQFFALEALRDYRLKMTKSSSTTPLPNY